MKNIVSKFWGIVMPLLAAGMLAVSCDKPNPSGNGSGNENGNEPGGNTEKVTFNCLTDQIDAAYEGGDYEIRYELKNPAEDGKITASSEESWISPEYNEGKINVNVAANEKQSGRSGKVTVAYNAADTTITFTVPVRQQAVPGAEIQLNVTNVGTTTADCSVIPADKTMNLVCLYVDAEEYEKYDTDDDWFAADTEYFNQMAAFYGISLESYMSKYVFRTGDLEFSIDGMDPDTDYYLYCYGAEIVGGALERLTAVYDFQFRTNEIPRGDTFVIEITPVGSKAIQMLAVAPDAEMWFCPDFLPASVLDEISSDTAEAFKTHESGYWKPLLPIYGFENCAYQGSFSYIFNVQDGVKYYACACEVDSDFNFIGDVYIVEYVGGQDQASVTRILSRNIDINELTYER